MAKPTANFNASDLATVVPGLIVVGTSAWRWSNRDLSVGQLANADKSVMSSAYFKDKKQNVQVEIGQDTRELLDTAIDTLYSYLQPQEALLVLSVAGGTRQWTATVSNVSVSNVKGGHAEIDIEFQCSNPIGQDVNPTQLFSTALTSGSSSVAFRVFGSLYWQQPQITITFGTITGGSPGTVTVGNTTTGQVVSITRTWASNDVLVIDSINKKVTVNGIEVASSGAIPEWQGSILGVAGSMDYSDTFTTRTRTMVGIYYKRYA